MQMIRFSWSAHRVKDKIQKISDKAMRRATKKAYKYLRHAEDSEYGTFLQEHKSFLKKHKQDVTDKQRLRPIQFIETVCLECAVWPHLYWKADMCETFERITDSRRTNSSPRRPPHSPRRAAPGASSSEDDNDGGAAQEGEERHSLKRTFLAKLHSPLLGYGGNYELLHFVYDLSLWTDLGSKKNKNLRVPMRVLMGGHTFSKVYWKRLLNGLTDLVKQIGLPLSA